MNRHAAAALMLLLFGMNSVPAVAYESESEYGYSAFGTSEALPGPGKNRVDDARRIRKFELALKTLGIPAETAPDFRAFPRAGEVSQEAFLQTLRFIAPEGSLKRYLDLQPTAIDLYRDFFSHLLPDAYREYSISVRESGPNQDSSKLMKRLAQISRQARASTTQPLAGVRIIIDPGHMGNKLWDSLTGKYVEIRENNKLIGRVSEGQITLWTAFLAANALEKLGAIVKVTRADLTPVSKNDYRTYDYSPYLNQYFYDSLDGWMTNYLHLGDQELVQKVKSFPEVKKMFPKSGEAIQELRTKLYLSGEDLETRTRMIADFHPDLTIDIHYDAEQSNRLQGHTNDVEAYVPGYFVARETGSRGIRALAFQHALESRRWNESVHLASRVSQSVAKSLGLPLLTSPVLEMDNVPVAIKVKNGVYSRNLFVTRRSLEGLIVYLECLHYDHKSEFKNLLNRDRSATYQGKTFRYPARIQKVADGIQKGVVDYFRTLESDPGLLPLELEQMDLGSILPQQKSVQLLRRE